MPIGPHIPAVVDTDFASFSMANFDSLFESQLLLMALLAVKSFPLEMRMAR
jgi:hypothetical protein